MCVCACPRMRAGARVVVCRRIGDTSATAAHLRVKRSHENVLKTKLKKVGSKSYSPEHTSKHGGKTGTLGCSDCVIYGWPVTLM